MSVDRRFSDMSFALSLPRADEGQDRKLPAVCLLARYNDLQTRLDEGSMPVTVEMQHDNADVRAVIEHVLADRTGNWRARLSALKRMTAGR
jgi:hypothetical protein